MTHINMMTLPGNRTIGYWFVEFDEDSGNFCVARNVSWNDYEQDEWFEDHDAAVYRALILNMRNGK